MSQIETSQIRSIMTISVACYLVESFKSLELAFAILAIKREFDWKCRCLKVHSEFHVRFNIKLKFNWNLMVSHWTQMDFTLSEPFEAHAIINLNKKRTRGYCCRFSASINYLPYSVVSFWKLKFNRTIFWFEQTILFLSYKKLNCSE